MAYKTCIFCNRNDSKPSREHVLPTWIAKEFPDLTWTIIDLATNKTRKTRGHLGIISKKPCKRCNTGWMNDLEKIARPILVPLMRGLTTTLTREQQLVIVRWFIKTVIMYELTSGHLPHFEDAERHALMKELRIPRNSLVFLGQYGGANPIEARETIFQLFLGPKPDSVIPIAAYAATFIIKRLVLQVVCARTPKNIESPWLVPPNWNAGVINVWPIGGIVTWPPSIVLDDEGFEEFANRWA